MFIVLFENQNRQPGTADEPFQHAATHSSTSRGAVRTASAGDRGVVTAMLAAAFQDDPVMSFIFPDAAVRRARMPRLFAIAYDLAAATGARYMTVGGEAATLWRAPGHVQLSLREKFMLSVPWLATVGMAFERALAVSATSDVNRPIEPHWYLDVVGCAPDSQRRGFGGAAIRAGLARADADGVASYAETANERNLDIYNALGFVVTHCWWVPDGPMHWSMLRAKKAGSCEILTCS
jgi:GNAT superfamily N-acetyltransferase